MATQAPTDGGSIQGDTWHDYVGYASAQLNQMISDVANVTNAINGI